MGIVAVGEGEMVVWVAADVLSWAVGTEPTSPPQPFISNTSMMNHASRAIVGGCFVVFILHVLYIGFDTTLHITSYTTLYYLNVKAVLLCKE